jgi:hypothetical protein
LQAKKAISRVYDYILGREQSLDLAGVLKETLLNKQFAVSVIEKAEVMELIRESLREELVEILPVGQQQLVPYIDEVMPRLDPWLKDQIDVVTNPVIDYLLGENTRLRVTISLDPMKSTLKAGLRDAFVRLPPPELAGASGDELDSIYNQYYEQFAAQIPSTTVIDEASLGMGSGDSFAQVITDAESALAEAKTAVGYFRTGYVLTLVFIGLLILGIILIWREVKGATRDLGIVLLIYGALEYGGVLVAKYFIRKALMLADLPSGLQSWLPGLVADVLRPVEILSLSLAVGGVALIVVSVVYRRRSSEVVTVRSDKEP